MQKLSVGKPDERTANLFVADNFSDSESEEQVLALCAGCAGDPRCLDRRANRQRGFENAVQGLDRKSVV